MFLKKKTNYIFASFGDEKININDADEKNKKKSFFLKKFIQRTEKKEPQNRKTNIFELSEILVSEITKFTNNKCFCFYLNLENTHDEFINGIQTSKADQFFVFPLYPQYHLDLSLIANFFSLNLYDEITNSLFWVKSFHNSPFFIKAIQKNISFLLKKENLNEKETFFLFLANEYENCFLYNFECENTGQNIIKNFQFADGKLCFFNENNQTCLNNLTRKNIIIIPISTLIDDINTKKNIEFLKNILEKQKKTVFITKTLNHNPYFIRSVVDIIEEKSFISNKMLMSF